MPGASQPPHPRPALWTVWVGSWHPGPASWVLCTIVGPRPVGRPVSHLPCPRGLTWPGWWELLLGATLPGLLLLGPADGGPQLGVGIPQCVLLAGCVSQRPAGILGLPLQPLPGLLTALQLPAQRSQHLAGLVQLHPQSLSLRGSGWL